MRLNGDVCGEAVFDEHGIYRYRLSRLWDETRSGEGWIMLNPSTATAMVDDRTINRVVSFSRAWGHGAAIVVNLFAHRARRPVVLSRVSDPVGPLNDDMIVEAVSSAPDVIAAWGNHGTIVNPVSGVPRCEEVQSLLASEGVEMKCLRVTGGGHPGHPLYLPASSTPMTYGHSTLSSPASIS